MQHDDPMSGAPDVGAPDPELDTSPIAQEGDEEYEVLKQAVPGEPVCLFNGVRYAHNAIVRSGTSLLRCDFGIWVVQASSDPDNP